MIDFSNDRNRIKAVVDILKKISKKKKKFVHLHEPSLNHKDVLSVNKAITEKHVSSYGKYTSLFEKKLKKYTKSKNVVSTVNGTSALHISLILANVKEQDEVIVSTLGFVSSVNVVSYLKATPHFVDCEDISLGIDPDKLEKYLTKNTILKNKNCINKKTKKIIKAIIVTHVFGYPCQIVKILKVAKKFKIKLIEDSAECLGSWYKKKHLGTFGDFGVLSFNGNKIVTTGGGGAILTNNFKDALKALKLSKNMKIKKNYDQIFDGVGYNYRLPSINAALGCSQIEKINFFLKKKENCTIYIKEILIN